MAAINQAQAAKDQELAMQQQALYDVLPPLMPGGAPYGVHPLMYGDDPNVKAQHAAMDAVRQERVQNADLQHQALPPGPVVPPLPPLDPTKAGDLPPVSKRATMNPRQREIYRKKKALPKQKKA